MTPAERQIAIQEHDAQLLDLGLPKKDAWELRRLVSIHGIDVVIACARELDHRMADFETKYPEGY